MNIPHSRMGMALLISILFLSSNAWADLMCGENLIVPGATTILRLSGTTNAHGESTLQPGPAKYTGHDIKCYESTFPLVSVGPTQSNRVTLLNLSTLTNAHGEEPTVTPANYFNPIEIGDNAAGTISVRVRDTTAGFDCSNIGGGFPYTEVVRLSGNTNAHMQIPFFAGVKYPLVICAGYDPLAGGGLYAPEDLLGVNLLTSSLPVASPPAFPNPPLALNTAGTINVDFRNNVFGSLGYDEMTTLQISGICDITNVQCQNIVATGSGYDLVKNEIDNFITTGTTFIIPGSLRVNKYGIGTTFDSIYDSLTTTYSIPGQQFPTNLEDSPTAITNYSYIFTPATLNLIPTNTYKFFTVAYRAEFDYGLSTPPITNRIEEVSDRRNNIQTFIFDVTSAIPIPITGTAGDVYVLENISIPNVFQNGPIDAMLTIENKNKLLTGDTPAVTITTIIRNSKGISVPGFIPTVITLDFSSSSTQVVSINLQPPCAGITCTFVTGETYTLYATIQPYVDAVPLPIDYSESIVANNSGIKTFTGVEPPQALSIPDSPWWMSMLVFGMIAGWLFVSTRKLLRT